MLTETKTFPLRDILSVTTDHLLTKSQDGVTTGIESLYTLIRHLTGEEVTGQTLPYQTRQCRAYLHRMHPELANADTIALTRLLEAGHVGSAVNAGNAAGIDSTAEAVDQWLSRCLTDWGMQPEYALSRISSYDVPQ